MSSIAIEPRTFEPGTTGWTVHDLDDPAIAEQWIGGQYEIVEGVLTKMPAAYFAGGRALQELVFILKSYLKSKHLPDNFATEVDIVIDEARVPRADAAWLTADDWRKQLNAVTRAGGTDPR